LYFVTKVVGDSIAFSCTASTRNRNDTVVVAAAAAVLIQYQVELE
jgi:hypothetical protein